MNKVKGYLYNSPLPHGHDLELARDPVILVGWVYLPPPFSPFHCTNRPKPGGESPPSPFPPKLKENHPTDFQGQGLGD